MPSVRLTEVFRQAARSMIVRSAHAINEGELPSLVPGPDDVRDFFVIERDGPRAIFDEVCELAAQRLPKHYDLDPAADVQVLAPMHKGPVGIDALNDELRARLNPDGAKIEGTALRVGDKVMQTRNSYEHDLFNGERGVLVHYDSERDQVHFAGEDGRRLMLPVDALDTLRLAYAASVHKAQGSQARAIVVPIFGGHRIMLTRNLVYTAVTRAQDVCVVVGETSALAHGRQAHRRAPALHAAARARQRMSAGLAALLDDVAVLARAAAASVDDVAAGASRASVKAAGVIVDDAAVTPRYVQGFQPERELPMIKRIATGSLRNKLLFILPAALALSELLPGLLTPILMLGGTYLCYEGAEKIWEKISPHHHAAETTAGEQGPEHEDALVGGAIRTDFILSAEIMVISLNEVADEPLLSRALILVVVAFAITAVVYGAVALIVKMDDVGLRLAQKGDGVAASFGRGLVRGMPVVLSVLATRRDRRDALGRRAHPARRPRRPRRLVPLRRRPPPRRGRPPRARRRGRGRSVADEHRRVGASWGSPSARSSWRPTTCAKREAALNAPARDHAPAGALRIGRR